MLDIFETKFSYTMILILNFLKLFSFLQLVGEKQLGLYDVYSEIEDLLFFKVFRQFSGIALKRLKRKKCSAGETVEYNGSKSS